MKYPNAYRGVKKIFNAQILALIATACMILAVILALLTGTAEASHAETASAAAGMGTILFFAGSAVLMIIGYIINLVGLHQAGKDEDMIRIAFWIAILALILTVVQGILQSFVSSGIGDEIASILQTLCNIFVTVFVVLGISNLANKLNDQNLSDMGKRILVVLIVFNALSAVAQLIKIFFGTSPATTTIINVLTMISSILSLVNYIIYLVYLGKAKKMLAEN